MFTDRYFQRPAKQTTLNQFLQRFNGSTQSVEGVSETEPGIQTKHASVLFYRFHHTFTFTDRTCHRFFTPDIFSCFGSFYRHNTMPVGRRRNMHDINVRVEYQITEIMISGDLILHQLFPQFKMFLVDITNGNQTCSGIVHMTTSHSACTYNTFCQLVAWSDKAISKHVTRHNRKGRNSPKGFKEVPSVCSHSTN